jgi:hypothetical protein
LTAAEQSALSDLGYHWGDYYSISLSDGRWRASPIRDSASVITASTAAKLGELLMLDFADRHPVPGFASLSDRMTT